MISGVAERGRLPGLQLVAELRDHVRQTAEVLPALQGDVHLQLEQTAALRSRMRPLMPTYPELMGLDRALIAADDALCAHEAGDARAILADVARLMEHLSAERLNAVLAGPNTSLVHARAAELLDRPWNDRAVEAPPRPVPPRRGAADDASKDAAAYDEDAHVHRRARYSPESAVHGGEPRPGMRREIVRFGPPLPEDEPVYDEFAMRALISAGDDLSLEHAAEHLWNLAGAAVRQAVRSKLVTTAVAGFLARPEASARPLHRLIDTRSMVTDAAARSDEFQMLVGAACAKHNAVLLAVLAKSTEDSLNAETERAMLSTPEVEAINPFVSDILLHLDARKHSLP